MARLAQTFRRPLSESMRPWESARRHAKERHVCATRPRYVGPDGVRPGASAAGPYKFGCSSAVPAASTAVAYAPAHRFSLDNRSLS
jgi:hypothetical protein